MQTSAIAAALRSTANLFSKMAASHARDAMMPWARPSPLHPADLAAMSTLRSGRGPIGPKFFDSY